jgi:hypothetical protein
MFIAGTSVKEQLEQLEATLGFDWDDQDWGIVNADAARVAEFVTFFEQNYSENWSATTVGEYVDLVMESASDAIRADPKFGAACVDRFVAQTVSLVPDRLRYWTSPNRAIAQHLRELGL